MIEVKDLTKWYGPICAVDHISFHVEPGTIVGLLGPNGAGKSTTMKILTCYLPASSGTARVAGHDVLSESMAVRRCIGYMPESVPLYPEMRVCGAAELPRGPARHPPPPAAGGRRPRGRALLAEPARGRDAPASGRAVARLQAARRPGRGAAAQPAGAGAGRADPRPGPGPDSRDARADPLAPAGAHGDPVQPHPGRGGADLQPPDHHRRRADRRAGLARGAAAAGGGPVADHRRAARGRARDDERAGQGPAAASARSRRPRTGSGRA